MKFVGASFALEVNKNHVFHSMLDKMKREVTDFMEDFHDDPSYLSAWGHNYFCSDDGGRLIFDLHSPKKHVCSICGKVYEGQLWDEVWVYFYRNLAMVTALKSATIYKATGETLYKEWALLIIGFYAKNYTHFVLHNKEGKLFSSIVDMEWGCGRILPQGLNESILFIRMVQALELLKDGLDPEFIAMVHSSMIEPFYEMIKPQIRAIHNIPCWNLSALGTCAAFFGDTEILDFVFHSEFNIRRQLHEGVTEDGFWYEGSIHYNFFLLEGITTFAVFCKVYEIDLGREAEAIIQKMLVKAYALAFDNHQFPVPNDGWPDINLKTFSYVYYLAAKVFGEDSPVGNLVKNIECNDVVRTKLPLSESYYCENEIPLERLLFAYDFNMRRFTPMGTHSQNYPKSNFVMLREGPVNVFLKYGLNGPSHAHPDIMNIEVSFGKNLVSRDLSNSGYQSRLCNEWHRKTICHNTVCCDGKDITSRKPGKTISYTQNSVDVNAIDVYKGIDYERKISITSNSISDCFLVTAREDGTRDYFFHLESDFSLEETFSSTNATLGFTENGYQYIEDVREMERDEDEIGFYAENAEQRVHIVFALAEGQKMFVARTFDNPVNRWRTTFIVRAQGKKTEFHMQLSVMEKE